MAAAAAWARARLIADNNSSSESSEIGESKAIGFPSEVTTRSFSSANAFHTAADRLSSWTLTNRMAPDLPPVWTSRYTSAFQESAPPAGGLQRHRPTQDHIDERGRPCTVSRFSVVS